jgi:hypothetical protein
MIVGGGRVERSVVVKVLALTADVPRPRPMAPVITRTSAARQPLLACKMPGLGNLSILDITSDDEEDEVMEKFGSDEEEEEKADGSGSDSSGSGKGFDDDGDDDGGQRRPRRDV